MTKEQITSLVASKLARHRLSLVCTGKSFECFRAELESICEVGMSVSDFLAADISGFNSIFVSDLESACAPEARSNLLGALRVKVDLALENDTRILLGSRFPKTRFPLTPGSSVIDDARAIHLPLSAAKPDEPLSCFPGWSPGTEPGTWLGDLLRELGLGLIARLDTVLFESQLSPLEALNALGKNELEALYFTGLIRPAGDAYAWGGPNLVKELQSAVENILANTTSTPVEMPQVFDLLWEIERQIRCTYRVASIAVWGAAWKDSCLSSADLKKKVLTRAGDFAYRGVKSLSKLRDPLEWLTLSELLALIEEKSGKIGDLGVEASLWRRFAMEVLPIRNQVSHMRLIRSGDVLTLQAWSTLLRSQLKASPRLANGA